ncbi:MAG: hypothetical protein HUK02_00770 [Bacteroidaceae bacterium]|nr:hypothetical protein [Bacteroidaceae bacterium]
MKTMNNVMRAMMVVMVAMVSTAAMAQRRGHNSYMGGPRHGREMVMHNGGRMEMRHHGPGMAVGHAGPRHHAVAIPHHDPRMHDYARWEGRVRHMPDGRWGYYRDNCWYYYNTYFAPDYYYAHPVAHFHDYRLGPVGKAAVATVAVASLIAALAH